MSEIKKDSKILKVSFSALETYHQCPRKYLYNYILGFPKKFWPWLVFGTFCHLVLEKFHKYVIYFQKRNKQINFGELMSRAFLSAMRVQRRKEAQGEQRLSEDQKNATKPILANYLKKIIKNFPNVIYVEKGFDFRLGDINVRGYIDRIDQIDKNTFEVTDYKTSSKSFDVNKTKQLDLYAYSFSKIILKRDDIKIVKHLDFLKLGQDKTEDYEKEHEEEMLDFVKSTSKKIKNNLESSAEKDWPFKVNGYCKVCDFKDRCHQQRGMFI